MNAARVRRKKKKEKLAVGQWQVVDAGAYRGVDALACGCGIDRKKKKLVIHVSRKITLT